MMQEQTSAVGGILQNSADAYDSCEPPTTVARVRRKRTLQIETDEMED